MFSLSVSIACCKQNFNLSQNLHFSGYIKAYKGMRKSDGDRVENVDNKITPEAVMKIYRKFQQTLQ